MIFESAFRRREQGACRALLVQLKPCFLHLINNESSISRQRTGCRRCTDTRDMSRLVDLCPTELTEMRSCTGASRPYVDKILKGSKACRPAGGAADEIRVRHQPEDRQADRPDDSAQRAGESGQGDQVILILLTTGTTARREVSRHLKQVGCTPVHRTSPS